ncbi:MAG TPA: NAD(+) synthase [Planctomycetota bacterium]|nr:NAD(+) synthase [Planctomycetota bacterium]
MDFPRNALAIDPSTEAERIADFIREQVLARYRRKGVVVGLSGGVDSALVAALAVRALGAGRVLGLMLPEKESSPVSTPYALEQAQALGIEALHIDLTPVLSALGVYEQKARVITRICPVYNPDTDRTKITLPPNLLRRDGLNVYSLTVEKPDGSRLSCRLGPEDFRALAAAQNMKQRSRMIQLYLHAERLHYAVCGTTNRPEFDQGFFVKHGDGAVDLEPICHLYKGQVFALARHLGVTANILKRTPSPDTWSGGVSDEEFFFRMPYEQLDGLLCAWNGGATSQEAASALGLEPEQTARAFRELEARKRASWHLRTAPPSLLAAEPAAVCP